LFLVLTQQTLLPEHRRFNNSTKMDFHIRLFYIQPLFSTLLKDKIFDNVTLSPQILESGHAHPSAIVSAILVSLLLACMLAALGYYVFKHKIDPFRFHYFKVRHVLTVMVTAPSFSSIDKYFICHYDELKSLWWFSSRAPLTVFSLTRTLSVSSGLC